METTTTTTPQPMPVRKFKNRGEQVAYYAKMRGRGQMTPEQKKAFDEAIRMVTNLD